MEKCLDNYSFLHLGIDAHRQAVAYNKLSSRIDPVTILKAAV